MKRSIFAALLLGLAFTLPAHSQDPAQPRRQAGRGPGQRGGMGGMGGGFMSRGITGTVTDVAADHFNVKTLNGETYTIHYTANTRFMKQTGGPRADGQGMRRQRNNGDDPQSPNPQSANQGGRRMMGGGNPPQPIKSTDIKVGDAIAAVGEIDAAAKSVGAMGIVQLDPERARQMEQMQANYGKTWLLGKVTAINEAQVTIQGSIDNAPHTFVADENTTFRERQSPITLADIHVGDMVRVTGTLKDGAFAATAVNVMRPPAETRVPRNSAPPQ